MIMKQIGFIRVSLQAAHDFARAASAPKLGPVEPVASGPPWRPLYLIISDIPGLDGQ
jgi:hypothetical protein